MASSPSWRGFAILLAVEYGLSLVFPFAGILLVPRLLVEVTATTGELSASGGEILINQHSPLPCWFVVGRRQTVPAGTE